MSPRRNVRASRKRKRGESLNENQEGKIKARVARELVEKAGVNVNQLLDKLLKAAGAELS